MKSKWSDEEAEKAVAEFASRWGRDLALRTYAARLLGREKTLVLHGGGNTSVKGDYVNLWGERVPALYMKASGHDLATISPEGHPGLDLDHLNRLRSLPSLRDEEMVRVIRSNLFDFRAPNPSIETLVHALIPKKFIDHTHADAILVLTNQRGGRDLVKQALGEEVLILDYIEPGFQLSKAVAEAFEKDPGRNGMVWLKHGLTTWGDTARESYEATIKLVNRAEEFLNERAGPPLKIGVTTSLELAQTRWSKVAPILRGLLAEPSGDDDRPWRRVVLRSLIERETLDIVDSDSGRTQVLTPPLTSDHLIRTRAYPLWVKLSDYEDPCRIRKELEDALADYRSEYQAYLDRNWNSVEEGIRPFPPQPRFVLLPGIGAAASGEDVLAADVCKDIVSQTLRAKATIGLMGEYEGLSERDLFVMEYRGLQHAKLVNQESPLQGQVAVVTGAAGAIGYGISRALLVNGCHVAVTDLPGDSLDSLVEEFQSEFGSRVMGVRLDVTEREEVRTGFEAISANWGGVDLVVSNAGLALVSSLQKMELEAFRRLERVNTEGTLLILSEAARHFKTQNTGGDVVLISTKNVFAPGANFGAYSATKAASHQLARIGSLELAELGVRVNMVSPDAVFEEGERKSGLWAEVGPDRMRARGLDEKQLQDYYRNRNLLKSRVTAKHVANAVLFFATRQTPTTGATIPVDGGLPDATPR
jgi:rhamnose utilization protein RhaD (predicted bifunctional aldolase and dehydrogenase)/NAD(P)-dependent dehydrogenase (short-subunit alcohol dehydrogenase family)